MLTLSIGPLVMGLHHLLLLVSFLLASLVGWWISRKGGGRNPESVLFNLLLTGLVAARLAFVARYWAEYRADPWQILDIRDGGFLAWPGVLVALLAAAYRAWRSPGLRRPLGLGLGSGLAFWLLGNLALNLYEQGTRLPEIALQDAAGRPVNLADYRGRPLVINLWATWCPPCRREMPMMQQAQVANPDVHFVFLNQGEDAPKVRQFLTTQRLMLSNVLLDAKGLAGAAFGYQALPATLFFDAGGRLVETRIGELSQATLQERLVRLRAAGTPTKQ